LISARASGDLDVVRRLLAGAVFRAALRIVRVAFPVPRFADPFVERLALFAVLLVFRVPRAALFVVRLPVFRALRAAFFVVVVAFFAGMSCSLEFFLWPSGLPRHEHQGNNRGPRLATPLASGSP
jgi:hypothetical protein